MSAPPPFRPNDLALKLDPILRNISRLSTIPNRALLAEWDRRQTVAQHRRDPLQFARDVVPHHFSLAIAPLHRKIVWMTFGQMTSGGQGSESPATPQKYTLPRSSTPLSPHPESQPTGGSQDGQGKSPNAPEATGDIFTPGSAVPTPSEIAHAGDGQWGSAQGVKEIVRTDCPVAEGVPTGGTDSASRIASQYVAIAAPRGFAKSTLVSFLLPLWAICHDQRHFIVLISNTHAQAVKFLQMIRYEFETNTELKRLYPTLTPHKDKWSDQEIELLHRRKLAYKIVAMGAGAQVRGLRFLQYRPDLLILDDVENEELVDSEIRRADLKAWLDRTVLHVNSQAQVIVIGTILHEASVLNKLTRQPEDEDKRAYGHWTRRVFQAMEFDQSAWEAYESSETLRRFQARDPEAFSQEKQNVPVGAGYKSFDKPEFWTERRFRGDWPNELSISITLDPASTTREYSDDTAIVVAGWDSQARLWVLEEEHAKYADPDVIIDRLLAHYLRWTEHEKLHPTHKFYAVGIEKVAFQKFLIHQFKQTCTLRKLHPYVVELKGDRDKTRRIRELVPLFAQDRIVLRPEMTFLEQQLRAFPKGAHDDVADALAYHLAFGQLLPPAAESPSLGRSRMTFKDYVDHAEEWKRERFRLAGLPLDDVSFVPLLWYN